MGHVISQIGGAFAGGPGTLMCGYSSYMNLMRRGWLCIKIIRQGNEADSFTKKVDAGTLHRHSTKLCGVDGLLVMLKGEKP